MSDSLSRREVLKRMGAYGAALSLRPDATTSDESADLIIAGQPVELSVWSLSKVTARITVKPIREGIPTPVPRTGQLVREEPGARVGSGKNTQALAQMKAGDFTIKVSDGPPSILVLGPNGDLIQHFVFDAATPGMSFLLGKGPLLGLGEGGPQFDRKGTTDRMVIGQGGYRLATNGTRAPVQWLIGTAEGWAFFIHQPFGAFDFTGSVGRFTPPANTSLPLDLFICASTDPAVLLREYATITGFPELPARWTLGYQQSHRTLAGREEILAEAKTFREKKLPCDTMIYLGTEFAPSGWNTRNGEFTWHPTNFPDPKKMLDQLHADHFKVVVHTVIEGRHLYGNVADACTAAALPSGRTADDRWPPDRQISCYWPVHKEVMEAGVDGFWPDQGDGYDGPSELRRHQMYWEGPQLYRPNERPFHLHRNASAGVQRFGGYIWSGDVVGRWETLKTHVPNAINTGLTGLPYWGTDIGGFNPSAEYTGELHVRWFQFMALAPLFRAHGRNWHLKLPWGWNNGDGGPFEAGNFRVAPAELMNAQVEPICRKYLNLRYQMLPYTYTAMRESHETGLPMIRSLWLHYPTDPLAAACGDAYLWGRDILVAPVVDQGVTTRAVYLPKGKWFDFWTEKISTGGATITREVDLATMPLFVRAGAVIPMGPVKQFADEASSEPLKMTVYPGEDGTSYWYDDDGKSFAHRRNEFTKLRMMWNERDRRLNITLVAGSKLLPGTTTKFEVRLAGSTTTRVVTFTGRPLEVAL